VFAPGGAGGSADSGLMLARAAAASLAERAPAPIYAAPVEGAFARAVTLGPSADAGGRSVRA
jgi:hypothetical protein